MPLHVSSTMCSSSGCKIVLYSLWYHHTETNDWSKITKIQFCKYEQIVVKFMCELFGCDYCVLLTITAEKFTHKFYYYLLIFTELYFSNF